MSKKFIVPFNFENCEDFCNHRWGGHPELAKIATAELYKSYTNWQQLYTESPSLKKDVKLFLFNKKLQYTIKE